MRVKIAEKAGFCPGARFSFHLAERVSRNGGKACILEKLLHNPDVVRHFEEMGMPPKKFEEITSGREFDTVVVRAHGVPKSYFDAFVEMGLKVEDGTCVHVKEIYDIVERYEREGYSIFVYGSADHPEVKGIVSRVKNAVVVADVADIPHRKYEKICLVSQTTQREENYEGIKEVLSDMCGEIESWPTICRATKERQDAARKLAGNVDVMVVVGGADSNNSKKLYDICREANPRTYFVQDASDLESGWFNNATNAGITAGASTPDWVIEEVRQTIADYNPLSPSNPKK
ncbi:4-hydroxy-3-methylbut-2-enyl diphosphate reductase [Candidatus Woesearchaeota archaeon]|nr:4-hydroxy-3-methylbut-2-enyl diphosphate reductase [Candidatus Woesearchaeota archaeon]